MEGQPAETSPGPSRQTGPQPTLKPWMSRILIAAGVPVPDEDERERNRLAWWGVEMERFLSFCRSLPVGTDLSAALGSYGSELRNREPALEDWRLDQAREALRAFRNGSDQWEILEGDRGREVKFRAKRAATGEPSVVKGPGRD